MRTISADDAAILDAGARAVAIRLLVEDGGGVYRDLTTYAGFDLVLEVGWSETIDDPGISWSATVELAQESVSAAPLMQNSPLNRAFNPSNSYAPLLQVGRRMKVEYSMQGEDDPRSRAWALAFEGYIGKLDSGGDVVRMSGTGLEQLIKNTYAQRERIYAFAQGSYATKGCFVFEPGAATVYSVGDLVVPTSSKANQHFYRVTSITTGIAAATEPTWPTGAASTVVCGGVTFTESGATSTSVGLPVETVMQQILDDNLGAGAVTLDVPTTPAWNVRWFLMARQPTFDELQLLADQIGWFVRYVVDAGVSKLRFFGPDRASTTSLRTFGPGEFEDVAKLSVDWAGIRNVVQVVFSDSQDLSPGGDPIRKRSTYADPTSIAKYGELFAEVAEAGTSNIDTSAEAGTEAQAILSDLSEPEADMQIPLLFFFAFAELSDLYTFSADGVHFDADQRLAVVSIDHRISDSEQATSLRVRGKPASHGKKGWFEKMTDAEGAKQHQLTALENVAPIALNVDNVSVGGARISFDWTAAKSPKDTSFELHLSTASGFSPDASTLRATGKERSFEVGNLDPELEYYAVVVPITWNAQKPIVGSPSAKVAFSPGRAKSTHLNPNVQWGRLPLNGGFETQTFPGRPPDFWFDTAGLSTGFFDGSHIVLDTGSGGLEGDKYLKIRTFTTDPVGVSDPWPTFFSAEFGINELKTYDLTVWRKCVSGVSSGNANMGVLFYDAYHEPLLSATTLPIDLNDNVGDWVEDKSLNGITPPAGARFARVRLDLVTTALNDQEIHIDSVSITEAIAPVGGGGGDSPGEYRWLDFSGINNENGFRHLYPQLTDIVCTTGETRIIMPYDGVLSTMHVNLDAEFPMNDGITNVCRFTVRKNGAGNSSIMDTELEVVFEVPEIGDTMKSNLTDEVTVVAGDYIGVTYNQVSMGGYMTSKAYVRILYRAT